VLYQLTRTIISTATIKQYAHLEEALVFGLATPKEILKKLEFQAFGLSLEHELMEMESTVVLADQQYASALAYFKEVFETTKSVPKEYMHEKVGRLRSAFGPVRAASEALLGAIEGKYKYLQAIHRANSRSLNVNAKELLLRETTQMQNRIVQLRTEINSIETQVDAVLTVGTSQRLEARAEEAA
jgi:hypothetical protein